MLAILIAGMGGVVSGLAGFGFGLFTVPLLLMLYPPATVTAVGSSLSLLTGWIVLLSTWRTVQVRTLGALIPGATIGVFLGTVLLRTLNPAVIKLIAGVVVLLFAISVLRGWRINAVHHPIAAPLAGALVYISQSRDVVLGGVAYTAGVPFFLADSRRWTHAMWHGFVLAGSALVAAAMAWGLARWIASSLARVVATIGKAADCSRGIGARRTADGLARRPRVRGSLTTRPSQATVAGPARRRRGPRRRGVRARSAWGPKARA